MSDNTPASNSQLIIGIVRRGLFSLLTCVLAAIFGQTAWAQEKELPAPNSSCIYDSSIALIREQIDSSKLIDDTVKRISVVLRAADLLWPYQEDKARATFTEAFDLATVNFKEKDDDPKKDGLALMIDTPDQRYVVIRAVAKRDPGWAKKLTEKILRQESADAEEQLTNHPERDIRTAAKLLDSASSLLSSDVNAAIDFARTSLRYPASSPLPRFLYRFAEADQKSADQFYQEALAAYRDRPLSEFLYLSTYPFGNNHAAGDMPVNAYYSVPVNFVPNSSLQRLFVQMLLLRAQQALLGKFDRKGFSGIPDDGQIWLALTRLEPQVQQLGPDLTETAERARREIFAQLTQDSQQSVTLGVSNQDPPKKTLDEQVEAAERERSSDKHDQLIVSAILRSHDTESPEGVVSAAGRITDPTLRQQVLNWIYYSRTQRWIKDKRIDEARRWAAKVEELDQRAYLYAEIAKESLRAIETQSQAREVLDEILSIARKAPNTIVTARTLLAVAYLYTKIDLGRSISVMGDAITCINHLEAPDFSRQSLVRRIEGKNFARYATFQTPGLSPENVFRELGKADFDDALYQASNLSDKSLRALATLALADICLQRSQPPTQNGKTKAKMKP
jgi:hypothetical protein